MRERPFAVLSEKGRELTIARDDKEFIVRRDLVGNNVRERRDDLLLGRKVCALLEFKVAEGARQCQVSVDAAEIHKPAGSTYTRLFA